jgi:hypothetical protein
VAEAQRALNILLGRSLVTVNGQLDPDTSAALRGFQAQAGLPITGDLDPATAAVLLATAADIEEARSQVAPPKAGAPERRTQQDLLTRSLFQRLLDDASAAAGDLARSTGRGDMPSSARSTRTLASPELAAQAFDAQRDMLFDVNRWDEISGIENASFRLFDENGQPVDRQRAEPGDFVRIDLPGPTGYDWVRVESTADTATRAEVVVRPSYDPTERPLTPDVIAHFFTSEAENTFSVERRGATVIAEVRGEHEAANVGAEAGDDLAAARNRLISEGAWGLQLDLPTDTQVNGMQQHQWNVFTENLADLGGER